jgi:hypothetical protein
MSRGTAGASLLLMLATSLVVSSPVAAQKSSFAQQIYGTWFTYPLGNPSTDPIRHEFRHNASTGKDEMIVTRICGGDYTSKIAKAVSPIEVTEKTIRVLKSVTQTEGEGATECKATIEAGTLNYIVSADGDRISITNPGGVPDIFDLVRQDAARNELLPSSIYGTWLMPVHYEGNMNVQIKLIFYDTASENHGKVREISICSKQNDSLKSQVDAKVRITKDEITILQTAEHQENDGPMSCTATITAGTLRYVVSPTGGSLVLTKAGQPPITLTREQS